jgi:hypothetical protein
MRIQKIPFSNNPHEEAAFILPRHAARRERRDLPVPVPGYLAAPVLTRQGRWRTRQEKHFIRNTFLRP